MQDKGNKSAYTNQISGNPVNGNHVWINLLIASSTSRQ